MSGLSMASAFLYESPLPYQALPSVHLGRGVRFSGSEHSFVKNCGSEAIMSKISVQKCLSEGINFPLNNFRGLVVDLRQGYLG